MHPRIAIAASAMLCAISLATLSTRPLLAAPADRYLHVQVNQSRGENVNVNLPLSVAEKVLPTLDKGPLHQGRVTVPNDALQGIDLRATIEALRSSPDNKILTVKDGSQDISVEKLRDNLIVHVRDSRSHGQKGAENVDVTVPLSVATALLSGTRKDELDVMAALRALEQASDSFLVTVESASEHVRVWVDTHGEPQ